MAVTKRSKTLKKNKDASAEGICSRFFIGKKSAPLGEYRLITGRRGRNEKADFVIRKKTVIIKTTTIFKEDAMKKISKDRVIFAMDKNNKPVDMVKSGDTVIFETLDCFSDSITSEDTLITNIDFSYVNPATGPIYVEGAEPGDVLKVTVESMELSDQGVSIVAPGFGLVGDLIKEPSTRLFPVKDGKLYYLGQEVEIRKMIGVIGTAPAGKPVETGTPGDHGGNMDSLAIGEGASLYLPVEVEGALFAFGDLHISMGDGEVGAAGVEIAGNVQVKLEVLKDTKLPTPFVETDEVYATIASHADWSEAGKTATANMVDFLTENTTLSVNDAIILLSTQGNLRVNQVVNPNVSFRMEIAKKTVENYRK